MTRSLLPILFFVLVGLTLTGQSVTGRIVNEFDEPVPFANVYVRQLETGTVSDDEGRYTVNFRVDGTYELVFSSLGYASRAIQLNVGMEPTTYDVRLLTSGVELEEITVSAAQRDPAYAIIKQAIARKAEHLRAAESYRTQVYLKATEEITEGLPGSSAVEPESTAPAAPPHDPFAADERSKRELLAGLNMVEMDLRLNYTYPRKYKEERLAYADYGDIRGLFVPKFTETDFNFYRNLVHLPGIADAPVISPLSNTSVLTYAFALESTDLEDGSLVYRIRVTPRKTGNSTVEGWIYINEDNYAIDRLDFQFPTGGLVFSDEFGLSQRYRKSDDNGVWEVEQQVFRYHTRQGKRKQFRGTTTLSYRDYVYDYPFPEKFFGNEVAVTTAEAYTRDSTYWKFGRTVDLTPEERRMVYLRDSIEAVTNSRRYQDSIQELYNRVTLLDLVWDGVGFRNNDKKSHLYFAPVSSLIDFSPVGGWRIGPYVSNYRRYPDGRVLSVSGSVDIGIKNLDVQGKTVAWYRYDPFRLGDVSLWAGRAFESFNPNDAYLNQLRASNYFVKDEIRVGQQRELFNGFYVNTNIGLADRRPLTGYDTGNPLDGVIDDEGGTVDFQRYQALISNITLSYTPGQRYMREPNRKVVLGSNWPTFSLLHRRGWSGTLGSDIRFDYLQFAVEQDVTVGALGNSKYRAQVGRFLNSADLRFVDIKRFRDSDLLLYSDPLTTFQALDASLNTDDLFVEVHHIHHFNGALINNIPLLKKTRIKAVAGGGLLWLKDRNLRYQEVFAGVERVFKLGPRRRVRLGLYGIAADSTTGEAGMAYKVSFDLIDIWKQDWNF
ncbi:DUF5686 and carboxypeptidase regulatory-like domain-containing protein [Lewinella sp. JB7]|uniref:DUF5686 and carboxypeptidase regulatory-like domain-containing protein n=1 Tax=Lewinella sp. JB7 TaxID=2962887 RepID=UPI0020C9FD4D|nr:DUF5686 and carboxypeptidase regulatory-like domain-containing protein [Lewinella sp. JB7]MCP9235144.1 DUF5686 and carboxypeptidase regulatory-like domain-containing protein [Lewinella sp. JB7]